LAALKPSDRSLEGVIVFGSMARSLAKQGNNLDLLVEWQPGRELLLTPGWFRTLRLCSSEGRYRN
jgi:predicted nucleotidyltransferase